MERGTNLDLGTKQPGGWESSLRNSLVLLLAEERGWLHGICSLRLAACGLRSWLQRGLRALCAPTIAPR